MLHVNIPTHHQHLFIFIFFSSSSSSSPPSPAHIHTSVFHNKSFTLSAQSVVATANPAALRLANNDWLHCFAAGRSRRKPTAKSATMQLRAATKRI
jgi:hypothetical protein